LETSFRGTLGNVNKKFSEEGSFFNALELNLQTKLKAPYLVFPFSLDSIFPKRYFKQTELRLGAGVQRNIGLGRVTYGTGNDYNISFRDTREHRLSILNTGFVTNLQNDQYYDVFTGDDAIRGHLFNEYYLPYNPSAATNYADGNLNNDQVIDMIYADQPFLDSLDEQGLRALGAFENMYFRKQTITQDVLISSMIYQYSFDESKRIRVKHPWFFRGRVELAGNIPALLDKAIGFEQTQDATGKESGMIFNVPYSQFIKVDLD